jgi:manganese efflux pump family protein
MAVAALIAWIVTALGGFVLLATWVSHGGHHTTAGSSRFPPALIFGHFLLAAVGLIVWIVFVVGDSQATAWIAVVLLAVVAVLGFTMFARWLPGQRRGGVRGAATRARDAVSDPAERHFPVPVVAGHGLLAATTLVLAVIAAIGGS